jgi:hypothetical protein
MTIAKAGDAELRRAVDRALAPIMELAKFVEALPSYRAPADAMARLRQLDADLHRAGVPSADPGMYELWRPPCGEAVGSAIADLLGRTGLYSARLSKVLAEFTQHSSALAARLTGITALLTPTKG